MRKNWSKEDKVSFNNSEVMRGLEERVLDVIKRVDILAKKATNKQELDELTKSLTEATKAKGEYDAVMNSADDDSSDGSEEDLTDEVIDDLRSLAKDAVLEGNYKLAYKIERTIDEILEEEVSCE